MSWASHTRILEGNTALTSFLIFEKIEKQGVVVSDYREDK